MDKEYEDENLSVSFLGVGRHYIRISLWRTALDQLLNYAKLDRRHFQLISTKDSPPSVACLVR